MLEARGHKFAIRPPGGAAHSILATPGGLVGVADERRAGALAAGH
jgi:gamma-glutamyltranspeptidase